MIMKIIYPSGDFDVYDMNVMDNYLDMIKEKVESYKKFGKGMLTIKFIRS